mgnify:CR=1 FL=1
MTSIGVDTDRRFYRDKDNAMLGGVCAGLADYLGFNLKVTRFLAFIAFLVAMPFAIVTYFAIVFLVPARSGLSVGPDNPPVRRRRRRCWRRERRTEAPPAPSSPGVAAEIDERCKSMDQRLAVLERHVTSKRFQIQQELDRL